MMKHVANWPRTTWPVEWTSMLTDYTTALDMEQHTLTVMILGTRR